MLNPYERVLLVARQSRIKPGGFHFTPNIIYATDRRIILRDPYGYFCMLVDKHFSYMSLIIAFEALN